MSHELTIRADGRVEMAYLEGVERWHGLGNELKPGASIEDWTRESGLDWLAKRAIVRYAVARGEGPEAWRMAGEMVKGENGKESYEGRVVLFRNDTGNMLGVVSSDYNVVQPRDVLEFWRDLVGAGGMELQTAGSLFGGRKLWALAKVGEASIIDPKNRVRQNLLIATSLDGSMATEAFYCSTVVVCNNTLRMAQGEKASKVKINHRSKFDSNKVKAELGIESAVSQFKTTLENMRRLAEKTVKPSDAVLMACELVKPGYLAEEDAKAKHRVENSKPVAAICERFLDAKAIGMELDGYKGTAWGFLNSVTEYVDHAARAKNADNRMDSAFFGKGAAIKERAYDMVTQYAPSLDDVIASTNAIFNRPDGELLDSILDETPL
jgi:phage/plasmid-like protein (TIGR03299 family)